MATRSNKIEEPQVTDWVNPLTDPGRANSEIASVISDTAKAEFPDVQLPPDDLVNLPGGLVKKDKVIRTAIVKELVGEDEEALARASQSLNPFHFMDRLLRCGVVQIGDEPVSETDALLKELLVGDREQLIMGIRKSTYGEDIEVSNWRCPSCNSAATLTMQLSDIPIAKLDDPTEQTTFKVKLRKGGYALVRLANGADQIALFENPDLNQAQRETILLSRCVISIFDKAGVEHSMIGFPSMAREMSVPDRHAVLNTLTEKQPGPRYDKIKYTCESCGEEVNVAVGIGDLFLDFRWV